MKLEIRMLADKIERMSEKDRECLYWVIKGIEIGSANKREERKEK